MQGFSTFSYKVLSSFTSWVCVRCRKILVYIISWRRSTLLPLISAQTEFVQGQVRRDERWSTRKEFEITHIVSGPWSNTVSHRRIKMQDACRDRWIRAGVKIFSFEHNKLLDEVTFLDTPGTVEALRLILIVLSDTDIDWNRSQGRCVIGRYYCGKENSHVVESLLRDLFGETQYGPLR